MIFDEFCNSLVFKTWIRECLIKELKTGHYVIMDNATFHKSQKVKDLIESVGYKVIFIPLYSPDPNPIEKFWANMKRWIKHKVVQCNNIYHVIASFFDV